MTGAKVKRRAPLGDEIADELRRRVVTREIPPGSHLVEDQLALEFDVSRGPVRDALKTLVAEGLVEAAGRRGLHVVGLSTSDIDELFSLRQALESLALTLAVQRDVSGLHARLEDAIGRMREAEAAGSSTAFTDADLDFHSAFYASAAHSRLSAVWQQYRPTTRLLLRLSSQTYVDLHPSTEAHVRLAAAARPDNLDRAIAELHGHLANARRNLLTVYEGHHSH